MAVLCSVCDIPYLRALSYALKNSVLSASDDCNCGLSSNWTPIMHLVIRPLYSDFEFSYMVNDLAKRTLPRCRTCRRSSFFLMPSIPRVS